MMPALPGLPHRCGLSLLWLHAHARGTTGPPLSRCRRRHRRRCAGGRHADTRPRCRPGRTGGGSQCGPGHPRPRRPDRGRRLRPPTRPCQQVRRSAGIKSEENGADTPHRTWAGAGAVDRRERRVGRGTGAAATGRTRACRPNRRVARAARSVRVDGKPPSRAWHRAGDGTGACPCGDVFRKAQSISK